MELRSEFSFATKPSVAPAKVLSADPGPIPGKSDEPVYTSHIDIPRAVKGEGSSRSNATSSQEGGCQDGAQI